MTQQLPQHAAAQDGANLAYVAAAGFESARRLTGPGAPSRLRAVHGHGFRASVQVRQDSPLAQASFDGAQVDALRERLRAAVAPLDYQMLNDHLAEPSDENLARWIRERLGAGGIARIGLQGTPDQGVELDAAGGLHVWRRYQFEAAHQLPRVVPGHKCGRMHGHGFAVLLHVDAAGGGAAADTALLDRLWAPLHRQLHHACLNDIAGLENPTSENLAHWLWMGLQPQLPALRWVTVFETATCGAHFDGQYYRIWKDLGFDSAVRLQGAPASDGRGRIHGHSYRLRLHLVAPLDAVQGWTIDFGDVKALFGPVFDRLDHHPLHELPGVAQGGSAALLQWVRAQALPVLPQLERVDLFETAGCGALLQWGEGQPVLPV